MEKHEIKNYIAQRVAKELSDGDVVNLGIGLPTLVANFLPEDITIHLQSENGMIGLGPKPNDDNIDIDITNAGGQVVTMVPGGAYFDSSISFGIIRGGHVDVTVLGALQVDANGSLASWIIPGKMVPGMGGAMDLVVGSKKVIIAMTHTNKGKPKILQTCTLPLTAKSQVNMIITEMAVIEARDNELFLLEINKEFSLQEVIDATEAKLNTKYLKEVM
ncbi:MAG: 3-oxoacid CoA-transferase subunit B [Candidatus Izemoplasma sp.]